MTLIRHKISTTDGHFPTAAQLQPGELAVNVCNGFIFLKKVVGTTESIVIFKDFESMYTEINSILWPAFTYQTLPDTSTGTVVCACANSQLPQFFIALSTTYSTLQITQINEGAGTTGLLFIDPSAYKLRPPIDMSGYLLMSDDVWVWDNWNYTAKSVVEYTTGPPAFATFTCTHHGYVTGSYVKITGYSGNKSSYNGVHKLTSVDLNTFRIDVAYQVSGTASSPTAIAQEKIFAISNSYTYIYEFYYSIETGDLYITFKNKVKRY